MAHGGFKDILKNGGFHAFLWTQFLGAFNDNLYQMLVFLAAVEARASTGAVQIVYLLPSRRPPSCRGTLPIPVPAGHPRRAIPSSGDMPFSADQELDADAEGLRLAIAAGYDPAAGPALFARMQQQFHETSKPPATTPAGELAHSLGGALASTSDRILRRRSAPGDYGTWRLRPARTRAFGSRRLSYPWSRVPRSRCFRTRLHSREPSS